MQHDYSEHEEEIAPDQMTLLHSLASKLDAADREVEELELKLKEAENKARQIRENDLPELMQSLGLKQLVTANGLVVKLREEVRASFFAKDPGKREPAYDWLREHGHDGLIKNTVAVQFGKEQEQLAEKFAEFVKTFEAPVSMQRKKEINHQTLLAFLREQLREGQEVPLPLFGAFVQKFVKIERTK